MDQQNEDLKHRTGKATDLEAQFEEVLEELVGNFIELHVSEEEKLDLDTFKPEIQRAKQRLLDVVSNTLIMDPH